MEISIEQQQDEDRAREFIKKHLWKFAKTMPWSPHFYVVKDYLSEQDKAEFIWFISQIPKYGKMMGWGKKKPKPYWFIDEYKYWTMAEEPIEIENILNRATHEV